MGYLMFPGSFDGLYSSACPNGNFPAFLIAQEKYIDPPPNPWNLKRFFKTAIPIGNEISAKERSAVNDSLICALSDFLNMGDVEKGERKREDQRDIKRDRRRGRGNPASVDSGEIFLSGAAHPISLLEAKWDGAALSPKHRLMELHGCGGFQ